MVCGGVSGGLMVACSVVFRVGGSVRWGEVTVGVFGARVTSGVVVVVCLSC